MDIWIALALEGNTSLIRLLNRIEKNEPGFNTVIIPRSGFSSDDDVHNAVLAWPKANDVNVWSPENDSILYC